MRSTRTQLAVLIAAVVVMLGLVSAPAGATTDADPSPIPTFDPNAVPAVAPENAPMVHFTEDGEYLNVGDETASPDMVALDAGIPCSWSPGGDYVHYSSGYASGHGWWTTGYSCRNYTATVWVNLYEYYSDGTWRLKKEGSFFTLKPYNYGGKRATTKVACDSRANTSWKSWVTAKPVSWGRSKWTPSRVVDCRRN